MAEEKLKTDIKETPTSAIFNLLFNIVIPVLILKKLSMYGGENGPLIALGVALCFPISYFLYEYLKLGKRSWLAVLGFFNTLLTGGFAVLQLEGIWFAVKEAAFPALIGIFVYLSPWVGKASMVEYLFLNPSLFKVDLLKEKLSEQKKEADFKKHLLTTNKFLALSFLLSAILNFVLAIVIFKEIPVETASLERSQILNEQISQMTWKSYIVILIPSMICLLLIFRYLSQGIRKYTGLNLNDLIKQN